MNAYQTVVESEDYTEAGVGHDWLGPEQSQQMVDTAYHALSEYADVTQ